MATPTHYWLVTDSRQRYLAQTGDIFIQDMQLACRFLKKESADSVVEKFKGKVNLTVTEVIADPATGQLDKVETNVDEQKPEAKAIPEAKFDIGRTEES